MLGDSSTGKYYSCRALLLLVLAIAAGAEMPLVGAPSLSGCHSKLTRPP